MSEKYFKYGKDIVWSLPLLFQYEIVWGAIFKAFKRFNIDLPQVNGFGCCACAWTGGRAPIIREELTEKKIANIFTYCKENNITPSLTFTCTQLTDDDLKNRYANYLLDIALDYDAHFIIYDDRLKDHIKNKKADAYTVASVIKSAFKFQGPQRECEPTIEKEAEFYNNLLKEYDLVVVRPEFSKTALVNNPEMIDDISRIEVLINQPCVHNCVKMPDHYRHLERFRNGELVHQPFECARKNLPPNIALENTVCHSEEMVKKIIKNGVKHLKLQGRGVGTQIAQHMMMLYGQMFRQDGSAYILFNELITRNLIDSELAFFQNTVLQNNPQPMSQPMPFPMPQQMQNQQQPNMMPNNMPNNQMHMCNQNGEQCMHSNETRQDEPQQINMAQMTCPHFGTCSHR